MKNPENAPAEPPDPVEDPFGWVAYMDVNFYEDGPHKIPGAIYNLDGTIYSLPSKYGSDEELPFPQTPKT